ncbi:MULTISPECIES: tetratricopeptide repeat protein [Actinomadura]|uniref:Tetratricopeptide repeat protein n=1 Tax=Actinomadura yumaensis TaxID=111807 RepID=A0ABW2CHJ9_9ACTN|nr:tetratricopeptide repeat protein [Actinomadura sp. J1-007]MWK34391.1 tetratricopeptide repeat protein [Actinomadura sp. J1-007]
MQFFARRLECKHIVWAGPLVDTAATMNVAVELHGRPCPTCGETVRKVDFVAIRSSSSMFDEPPAPRNAENKLAEASKVDVKRTGQRLAELGAETGGLAAVLKEAALGLTPPQWRGALEKIPVGILQTYEPNAECIRFKDSAVPAIVFHQGLAGYLFKMNRSIFPLQGLGSMSGGAICRFVEDEKTRSALRVQAVDTALEFLGVGKPRSKVLVEIPTIARFLEMPLTRTMSAFVLCHEYGHAVLNHADELRSVGRDAAYYLLDRSRAMEFEADTWGQDSVIGAFTSGKNLEPSLAMLDDLFPGGAPEVKQDISHAAPCVALLYFEFLDVIEERLARHGIDVAAQGAPTRRRARMAGKKASEHSSHPSNKERFQALYAHLSEHGNFTAHTWVGAFEMLLDEIKGDLDKLIDKTGAVAPTRLARRFRWPWSEPKRESSSWRDTITMIDDDDDTRIKLQEVLQKVEGQEVKLDEAEVWRHFERQKKRARAHFDKKEYAEAERIYTQILDSGETTESVPLYHLLGQCRERLGDQQGAIAVYRRCLEIVPGSDFAALCGFSLALLLFDKKDPNGAETALTAATTSHSPGIRLQAMFWLGEMAHKRHDVETALRWYRKIWAERDTELDLFPTVVAHAALNMGSALQARGQFAQATKLFEYARDFHAIEPNNRAIAEQHLRTLRGR